MEVTKKNFKTLLPTITESINNAHFLVIDTEFTGLSNGKDINAYDSPAIYYSLTKQGSSEFLLLQYGLACFYWSDEKNMYMNETYNFYVYPTCKTRFEKFFLCQGSSLNFMASQGFDFNKWIKEGIPYVTGAVEDKMRANLIERQKTYNTISDIIPIPSDNREQIETICSQVKEFLSESSPNEFVIHRCNGFVRKLVYQEIGLRFPNQAAVQSKIVDNHQRVLVVTRCNNLIEQQSKEEELKCKEWDELEESVGFTKVARIISESGKLVIGHNMLLDLLHTLSHFFAPLPESCKEFKAMANEIFPRLLDTKYMSSHQMFKTKVNSSVLSHLLETLSEPPFSKPLSDCEEGRGYKCLDDKHHEAGYDAYITGICFLSMYMHLTSTQRLKSPVDLESRQLENLYGKIFLSKTAFHDNPFLDLLGDEPKPQRDHVFHIVFPPIWRRSDITEMFSPFGPITVTFIDDTSAFVSLTQKNQAETAFNSIKNSYKCKIMKYDEFMKWQNRVCSWASAKLLKAGHLVQDGLIMSTPSTTSSAKLIESATENSADKNGAEEIKDSAKLNEQVSRKRRTASGTFYIEEERDIKCTKLALDEKKSKSPSVEPTMLYKESDDWD